MTIYQNPPMHLAIELLKECGLPHVDLTQSSFENFLGCGDEKQLDGIIGLEEYGEDGLLRSLAIASSARKKGYAKALVSKLEEIAKSKGIRHLYLLTNTAEEFFRHLGYASVERRLVSEAIKNSQEFSTLCPGDATVMRKSF